MTNESTYYSRFQTVVMYRPTTDELATVRGRVPVYMPGKLACVTDGSIWALFGSRPGWEHGHKPMMYLQVPHEYLLRCFSFIPVSGDGSSVQLGVTDVEHPGPPACWEGKADE